MKYKLRIALYLMFIFISCKSKNDTKSTSHNSLIDTRTDTIGLSEAINKTKNKLKEYSLQEISDSIKYQVYQTFYDEKIIEFDKRPSYFSFFPLIAVRADVFNNYDDIHDSFLIRFMLLIPSTEPIYDFVDVTYRFDKGSTNFQKTNAEIVGRVYLKDRWAKNTSEGIAFVNKNEPFLNKWYLNEFLKRNRSRK